MKKADKYNRKKELANGKQFVTLKYDKKNVGIGAEQVVLHRILKV